MGSARTISGRMVDIANPRRQDFCIEDIAHSLAREGRWGNHTRSRMPVLLHCMEISQRFSDPEMALFALLHDASEAYMRDIPGPYKEYLPDYKELEHHVQDTIYDALCHRVPTRQERMKVHFDDHDAALAESALRNDEFFYDEREIRDRFIARYHILRGLCESRKVGWE